MKVILSINNNAAVAIDNDGNEVVLLGKGVGYPKPPYELTDLSKIERTFYDINPQYFDSFGNIPQEIIIASNDIVEQALINLEVELNPNLTLTLADHIYFALRRMQEQIEITVPFSYDVRSLYPLEYEIGQLALDIIEDAAGKRLPESEAVNIALHLLNGELESGNLHSVLMSLELIEQIGEIVEDFFDIKLDKTSFAYNRFLTHIQYLANRLATNNMDADEIFDSKFLTEIKEDYPRVYECAKKIGKLLELKYGCECNNNELLFLALHVNRVKEKTE